jgi:DNA-binding MarR family transcriptional regulator
MPRRVPDDDGAAAWAQMRAIVEAHPTRGELRAALGLGRGSGRVKALFALARRSPLTVGEIAEELGVDAPYATLIVNHLEALGLVGRTADPDDRRRKLVSPTPAGRVATARAQEISDRTPTAFERLSADEAAQLRALLERLGEESRPTPSGRSAGSARR